MMVADAGCQWMMLGDGGMGSNGLWWVAMWWSARR